MTQLEPELTFDESLHRYFLAGQIVPNVTRVLEGAGLLNYAFLGDRREEYLERGRAVHAATHCDDDHRLDEESVAPEILGYLRAWRTFRQDFGFVPQLIEHRVFNETYRYAGCLDRVGSVRGGSELIIDIKTGQAPAAVAVQLAAYAACLPHPRARLRRCVELHADGSYRVIGYLTSDYQRDFDTFIRALETFRAKEEK